MKSITTYALIPSMLLAVACNNNKADQQKKMDEVMALHDKVMAYDEEAVKNKTQLDSLAKLPAFNAKKDSIVMLSRNLAAADSAMGEWMNKFNPDHSNKSNDEAIAYLNDQQKQIMKIDTQFTTALAQSKRFLSQVNKK